MKVLIADDDPVLLELLNKFLHKISYDVIEARNGNEALERARELRPDMILLDVDMPGKDGFEVCRQLRQDIRTRFIPILFLTGNNEMSDRLAGLSSGADDYLTKPFHPEELKVRLAGLAARSRQALGANPLTRLPGGAAIEEEVTRRIRARETFAFAYIDIDHFKAYNDIYGYKKGDAVIRKVASVLLEAAEGKGTSGDFVGHIGGDDFVLVSRPSKIASITREVVDQFDSSAPAFYNQNHRKLGYVRTMDRHGQERRFPLVSLSIAVVTNQKRKIEHYGQLVEVAAELKQFAKARQGKKGSFIAVDRRGAEKR